MKTVSWEITRLKLNRHKIKFSYSETNRTLILGGINVQKFQLLYIVLPFTIALILFVLASLADDVAVNHSFKVWIGIVAMIIAGIFGVLTVQRLKRSNSGIKKIGPGFIDFEGQISRKILVNEISEITVENILEETQEFQGEISVMTSENEKIELLGMIDKDRQFLNDDMEYVAEFIRQLVGIISKQTHS